MEMEQLLSMGFPYELAAQALAATGGKSTLKATEWILHHHKPPSSSTMPSSNPTNPNPNPNPNPNANPNPSPSPSSSGRPFQPKLDRFFHFHSKPPSIDSPPSPTPTTSAPPPPHPIEHDDAPYDDVSAPSPPLSKRPKLSIPPSKSANKPFNSHQLLSERMRPRTLDDVVGQDHLLGPNSLLRSAIESDRLPSIVLWGPPGTGKTSIAKAILNSSPKPSSYRFVSLSAVTCGVKDVREVVDEARKARNNNASGFGNKGKRTVLFVDEVHRFNKSQQDSFLPIIEDGSIVFMGATTENPSFHLITPLLSRCRVLVLHPLKPHHLALLLRRAVDDSVHGLNGSVGIPVRVDEEAVEFISANCDGDARVALNALEISATTAAARVSREAASTQSESENAAVAVVNVEDAKEALQCKHLAYDKAGEEHYNLISALHKSMRGSDGDAAIYWLARMLEGGEEPLYIARRLIRFASEDVGLADPLALNQAVACYQACHFLGMPECNVILAQCVAYLALAPKSISVYRAMEAAQKVVRDSVGQNEGVPLHLRNAPTKLMKEIGYGKGYIYTPDNPDATQSYLPLSLQGLKFLDWPKNDGSNR
ncbi:hypothetical protein FEM48_Zijuj04G0193100 [Ziziphus jujuba var. spinosa]|uniref:UBA domain-containing protein n=1 Tax=Ziziphus jujuba var. spinosa TaxID=714518 RepID=A0A978VLP8_ZIZJJ|nr:hypothetical protein FEM48_Zijuj04G0193100 [Ziziphus jujuba var. spinosa]